MNNLQQFPDYTYKFPEAATFQDTLKNLTVHIERIEQNEIEFDLIGLKPYVVNIFRQTILNDIPTMAIEDVYFYKNSSIFNCDYISQRLSLLPIVANPDQFKFVDKSTEKPQYNSDNCIVLRLQAANNTNEIKKVMSENLIFEPHGSKQESMEPVKVLFPNIPILYLKKNEDIELKVMCTKNIGRVHMKYHPGFARYVFLSKIDILNPTMSREAVQRLRESFPPGVVEINVQGKPYIANPRYDRHSRAFRNFPEVNDSIKVKYYRDHVIFNIESHGVIEPVDMFCKSLKIVRFKFARWRNAIEEERRKRIEP